MSADPVVYCLENVTDSFQFERFCSDFLVGQGYRGIEPLGGSKDKGRDALYTAFGAEGVRRVICAYSIRKDWRDKLSEDCEKIAVHAHPCEQVTFVCTAAFTPTERDRATNYVRDSFGWDLDLYGLERLRTNLPADLIGRHPGIFTPEFFSKTSNEGRDCLVVDYANDPEDKTLAIWIAQRLALAGYRVWCYPISPVAGDSLGATIEKLIDCNAYRYLCILSGASGIDPDFNARCSLAARQERNIVIPLLAKGYSADRVDAKIKALVPIDCHSELATGLSTLLKALEDVQCPKCSDESSPLSFHPFSPAKVILKKSETLYSNRFRLENVPEAICRFEGLQEPPQEVVNEAHLSWVFRRTGKCSFVAFTAPPSDVAQILSIREAGGIAWRHIDSVDRLPSKAVVVELVRQCINLELRARGLAYCTDSKTWYFTPGILPSDKLAYMTVDGKKRHVKVIGRKKFQRQPEPVYYRYYLSPAFGPTVDEQGRVFLIVKPRVRITDDNGKVPSSGASINSRRKHLCKAWWNKEWFARTLALAAYLRGEVAKGFGLGLKAPMTIAEYPESWVVPISIDEEYRSDFKPPKVSDVLDYALENAADEGDDSEK